MAEGSNSNQNLQDQTAAAVPLPESERDSSSCSRSSDFGDENEFDFSQSDSEAAMLGDQNIVPALLTSHDHYVDRNDVAYNLLQNYVKRFCDQALLADMIEMVNKILPKDKKVPKTVDSFFRYINKLVPPVEIRRYYYCGCCRKTLPMGKEKCTVCKNEKCIVFFELSIEKQLKNYLENKEIYSKIKWTEQPNEDSKSDLLDGKEFIRVNMERENKGPFDLNLFMNTDGLQLTSGAGKKGSCWPVLFQIAQIPEPYRGNCIVVGSVWYSADKPDMNQYLRPIVDQLKEIYKTGFIWKNPVTGKEEVSRVTVPLVVADAPARADLLFMSHHGGLHSCNTCYIEADSQMYHFEETPKLRSKESYKREGKLADRINKNVKNRKNRKPVLGIKGSSILDEIPLMNISQAVIPEAMHVLIGVVKQFFKAFLVSKGEAYSISPENRKQIDEFLSSLRTPSFINRPPRPTEQHSNFKASELVNWLIFFSVPSIYKFLPQPYLNHFILLVKVIHLLIKEKITEADIAEADRLIKIFLRRMEELYTASFFTYNIHQLIHFPLYASLFGPFSKSWAFHFEGYNHVIGKSVHGTRNFAIEIANRIKVTQQFIALKNLKAEENHYKEISFLDVHFCEYNFSNEEKYFFLERHLNLINIRVLKKVKIRGTDFTSKLYDRKKDLTDKNLKKIDYVVEISKRDVKEKILGAIKYFLLLGQELFLVLEVLYVDSDNYFQNIEENVKLDHLVPVTSSNDKKLIELREIQRIRHVIPIGDNYVGLQPYTMRKNL